MKNHIYKSTIISGLIAAFCIVYYILLQTMTDLKDHFSIIWVIIAVYFLVFSVISHLYNNEIWRIPKAIYWIFIYFAVIVVVFLGCAFGVVAVHGHDIPDEDADYVIVPGYDVNFDQPTEILKNRLDGAITYLEENPDTKVIVSGGYNNGSSTSESFVMKNYLLKNGIEESRIIEENQSTSTAENMEYSAILVDDLNADIVVITSTYHVYRAVELAGDSGFTHVESLGTKCPTLTIPHCYFRESLSVIKYRIQEFISSVKENPSNEIG